MPEQKFSLSLSHDVALLLYEFAANWCDKDILENPNAGPMTAETVIFVEIMGQLETQLTDQFDVCYEEHLKAARSNVEGEFKSAE